MSERARLGILISGRGSNMLALIQAVQSGRLDATVALVLSNVQGAAGLEKAQAHGIETLVISHKGMSREEHEQRVVAALKERRVDLVCLAGYMRLLSPYFISQFPQRILNIHPSLLPAFPGLDAQRQALAYGVKYSGCTVHFVDETLDGGPIIAQAVVPVHDDDTVESLAARILEQEHKTYVEAVALVLSGNYRIEGRRVIWSRSPA
ncbi:MAG: phosphoribosylglycinamide formyltransferase [Acidobacteriota bacterium]|nr:phosphoribosylglycinamide formyltransferase [Blastocatellia bacterium]MDW8238749.1 phosphoribosylglycinamide formyltransferase [Acidobacteriota bacterium]